MTIKDKVVIAAIQAMKASEHRTTAVKIEFEANIGRNWTFSDMLEAFLEHIQPLGWSKLVDGHWVIQKPLTHAHFYNDGSVDTELTLTVLFDKPEELLKLPQVVAVFADVCRNAGDFFQIKEADMHMALLNNKAGTYPSRNRQFDLIRFQNFRKSMIRLLPALYFLGSPNGSCRHMTFRQPQIEATNQNTHGQFDRESLKYSAVAFRHGSLEFRLFETCYQNPEVILDNLVVIANAMKFFTKEYTRNFLPPNPKPVYFGHDQSPEGLTQLERLYATNKLLDLLHDGLNLLKPSYYTITELKEQRQFTVTKAKLNSKLRELRTEAAKEFSVYQRQFNWEMVYRQQRIMADNLSQYRTNPPTAGTEATAIAKAKANARHEAKRYRTAAKTSRSSFIALKLKNYLPLDGGNYKLEGPPEAPAQSTATAILGGLTDADIVEMARRNSL